MKRLILAAIGLGTLVAVGFYINHPTATKPEEIIVEPTAESTLTQTPPQTRMAQSPQITPKYVAAEQTLENPTDSNSPKSVASAASKTTTASLVLNQAIETMVSPQTSYEQRQAALKQLKDSGKLDDAIGSLEQRMADNPSSVETVTALGEAYYKKAGQTDDVREKAILAMKADQSLEAALNLDPSNWDARFMKAVGMSYWPPELNKSKEVIEQFQTLVQQQETQSPQPQFARTYLLLGEQYEKAGYSQYAADVWRRGATFFPADSNLKEKLANISRSK